MFSQACCSKSLSKDFYGRRVAPSDHKWLRYCFTDRKAKICPLNMQPDEILKRTGVASELKISIWIFLLQQESFSFSFQKDGGCF